MSVTLTENDVADLKEGLRRCSPETIAAAIRYREKGDLDAIPTIVFGILDRYQPAARRLTKEDLPHPAGAKPLQQAVRPYRDRVIWQQFIYHPARTPSLRSRPQPRMPAGSTIYSGRNRIVPVRKQLEPCGFLSGNER